MRKEILEATSADKLRKKFTEGAMEFAPIDVAQHFRKEVETISKKNKIGKLLGLASKPGKDTSVLIIGTEGFVEVLIKNDELVLNSAGVITPMDGYEGIKSMSVYGKSKA